MSKSKKTFSKKKREDYFYRRAKKENLRSRSYFKLEEIDKRFKITKNKEIIADLGCSPGGWLEYLGNTKSNAKIVGIDKLEVEREWLLPDNVIVIEKDFQEYVPKENFDLIVSDIAPEFSGDKKKDIGITHKINLNLIEFADKYLKIGGDMVFKTFEGEDLETVRKKIGKKFKRIERVKPDSSSSKSNEFYYVCINKK